MSRTIDVVEKKGLMREAAVHDRFIHEHDFVVVQYNKKTTYLVQCVTCNEYFCQLCGKAHCSCVMK